MNIKTKFEIGDIVITTFKTKEFNRKMVIAQIVVRADGVWYFSGLDTRQDEGYRESILKKV